MTRGGEPAPTGLRTIEIRVPGANCVWCFNDATARLADLDGVEKVTGSILDGSVVVQCSDVPTALLVSTLRTYLHGSDDSSHECQMVAVEPEPVTLTGRDGAAPAVRDTGLDTATTMETLTEAVQRFRVAGYLADFVASPEGDLRCRSCDTGHAPETTEIRETVRFEGDSNPDDEAILLALSCANGCLGQFSAAFGPGTSAADALVLSRFTPDRTEELNR